MIKHKVVDALRGWYPIQSLCNYLGISRSGYYKYQQRKSIKAFDIQKDVTGLIVHSDQGSQYTSHAYHDMLPQVAAQSACHTEAIVSTTPRWRASSRISKRKGSLMIFDLWTRHKAELFGI